MLVKKPLIVLLRWSDLDPEAVFQTFVELEWNLDTILIKVSEIMELPWSKLRRRLNQPGEKLGRPEHGNSATEEDSTVSVDQAIKPAKAVECGFIFHYQPRFLGLT